MTVNGKKLFRDGMLGMAIGDAFGVPYEFRSRDRMRHSPCMEEMIGYGAHFVPAGTWSDDTSMALAIADSVGELGRVDGKDIMERFRLWLRKEKYTATGEVFDCGGTCGNAIRRYEAGIPAGQWGNSAPDGNGNGALMRTLPLSLWVSLRYGREERASGAFLREVEEVASLTHAHPRGLICCGLYTLLIDELVNGDEGDNLGAKLEKAFLRGQAIYTARGGTFKREMESGIFMRPAEIAGLPEEKIGSGGYVMDSWTATVWCLLNTDNYRDCVMRAVNLGSDTDTTACIAGGIGGLVYGAEAIPQSWRDTLIQGEYVGKLALRLAGSVLKEA